MAWSFHMPLFLSVFLGFKEVHLEAECYMFQYWNLTYSPPNLMGSWCCFFCGGCICLKIRGSLPWQFLHCNELALSPSVWTRDSAYKENFSRILYLSDKFLSLHISCSGGVFCLHDYHLWVGRPWGHSMMTTEQCDWYHDSYPQQIWLKRSTFCFGHLHLINDEPCCGANKKKCFAEELDSF
jgi:hypothetical protein